MDRRTFLTWLGLSWLASASARVIAATIAKSEDRIAPSANSKSIVFYVSERGNDAWSGKLETPNDRNTDGPFATLARSRDAIRELKRQQGGTIDRPITVMVRGGTYFLSEPLTFTTEDSGTPAFPITYAAYPGEKPMISGGKPIAGWRKEKVNGHTMWTVTLPEVRSGTWFFGQLWVNGQRRSRVRYPNTGYLQIEAVPEAAGQEDVHQGQYSFQFREGNLPAWSSVSQGEVVAMCRWVHSRLPIARVDESGRTVYFSKKSGMRLESGDLYYVENVFETLNAPGQWYLERNTGKLYYMPVSGERMNAVEAIAPMLEQLVILKGNPNEGNYVKHINFRNLTFAHTDGKLPAQESSYGQSDSLVPGAIYAEGSQYCSWEECTVASIGNYAIELAGGCQYNRIAKSELADLGAGGIKISASLKWQTVEPGVVPTHSNEVIDCHIHDGGRIFHSAVGIWIGHSDSNRISRNHIHDFYYTAISVGWTWGYDPTLAKNNIVESNDIHNIGKLANSDGPILSDMGGVYTLGIQPGTVIRSNIIREIEAFKYGGWGIYLDEGSSQIVVENNLVYRTRDGGFHQHYGKENLIRNNIFAFGTNAQIQRTKLEPHLSFTFERNIVYWRNGKLLEGEWQDSNFKFDRNLYWHLDGGEISFNNLSWDEWHKKGLDNNSIIADPLFVDPEDDDFELKPNSPAFKIGFQPISNS
jgi:parallel beta-helix repeat protein